MSYQVLARKYRPATFDAMVGQEHVLRALINALEREQLHHAYLFTGTRGVGKTTVARIFAKCLNCAEGVTATPCGECASCREIAEGRSVDLIEVDAASRTKVEDTRELLENVQYAPTQARYKVYLIDEVHMLSGHSFNALLKTLEEPPPHVKFLLATTDPQKLPATVLSRCLQFNLKNMPPDQVAGHLATVLEAESVPFEAPALSLLGRAAAGSMRDALSLTDQAIAHGGGSVEESAVREMLGTVDRSFIEQLARSIAAGEQGAVLDVVGTMSEMATAFDQAIDDLVSLWHQVAVAQAVPERIGNAAEQATITELAGSLTPDEVQLFYQLTLHGRRDLPLAPEPRTGFEMICLRMMAFRPAGAWELEAAAAADDAAGEVGRAGKKPEPGPSARAAEPVSANPEPAPPAPMDAGPAANDDAPPAPWIELLDTLQLVGSTYVIASNCELRHWQRGRVEFVLDEQQANLFNPRQVEKIRSSLSTAVGAPLEVSITTGTIAGETPAQAARRRAQERQAEAVAAIEGDDRLRRFMERFDGQLDRGSIAPRDSTDSGGNE